MEADRIKTTQELHGVASDLPPGDSLGLCLCTDSLLCTHLELNEACVWAACPLRADHDTKI